MTALVLKVKTKSGQNVLKGLTSKSTVKELKTQLSNLTDIAPNSLRILYGFPPKLLDLTQDSMLLDSTGLSAGDTLIVEECKTPVVLEETSLSRDSGNGENTVNAPSSSGILLKKVVPADNSCLFSSIYFVMNGREDTKAKFTPWLRQLISETVSKDPETYSEALLGKPNADYCAWIMDDKSWGGAIELSILVDYYGMEIAVVDTVNAIINRFGEDKEYPLRVFLMFDGIHYDPLYRESLDGNTIQTIFPAEDEDVLKEAAQLAKEAKSSRQFTDVNKFRLKCLVCSTIMDGQVAAQQHAIDTGHSNFGEI